MVDTDKRHAVHEVDAGIESLIILRIEFFFLEKPPKVRYTKFNRALHQPPLYYLSYGKSLIN